MKTYPPNTPQAPPKPQAPPPSTSPADHAACLLGSGIVCGLQVYVDKHCAIHVGKGLALTSGGLVIQQEADAVFHYHLPYDKAKEFKEHLPCAEGLDNFTVFKLLAQKTGDAKPLSPQNLKALNANSFLEDKVVVAYLEGGQRPTYLLLSQKDAAKILSLRDELKDVISQKPLSKPSLRPGTGAYTYTEEDFDKAMRPQLLLKGMHFRRFGFEKLALLDKDKPADAFNLVPCFWDKISTFATIHAEYAAIVEEAVDQINDALEYLHGHPAFYPLLTHKPPGYFKPYLSVLLGKWTLFISSPHVHKCPEYVQYFYDWAKDLAVAYYELKAEIDELTQACCGDDCHPWHVMLGKVKGGTSEYAPSVFRQELVQPPVFNGNAERLRKIKLLHWRLMMMIRTFDLPHLRLDETVLAKHFPPTAEEEDTTNQIERDRDKKLDEVKITPSKNSCEPLGSRAIPYYYPFATDNIYSLHLYWDYAKARHRRTDEHLTYNAFAQGYTKKDFVLRPLTYPIDCLPFLRVEGHIGKQIAEVEAKLKELKGKYNLGFDWVSIAVSKLTTSCKKLLGAEHVAGLRQHETLVLVYADNEETIEGTIDCSHEDKAVVEKGEVVADFTLPYRCCPAGAAKFMGKVVGCHDQKLIAGAGVKIGGETLTTNADGVFETNLEAGTHLLEIKKPDFETLTETLDMGDDSLVKEFTLTPTTADIIGAVSLNGQPVVGASVIRQGEAAGAVTDSDGMFKMSGLPAKVPVILVISFTGISKTFPITIEPCFPVSWEFPLEGERTLPNTYWDRFFGEIKIDPKADKAIKTREFFEIRLDAQDKDVQDNLVKLVASFPELGNSVESIRQLAFKEATENKSAAEQMDTIYQTIFGIFQSIGNGKNRLILKQSASLAYGTFLDRALLNAPLAFDSQPDQAEPIQSVFKKIIDTEAAGKTTLLEPRKIATDWIDLVNNQNIGVDSFTKGLTALINKT